MKVVLDTNVMVSGLMLPNSIPGRIVAAWRNAHFDLVLSEPMLVEIARVLAYPKIAHRLNWSEAQIERFILLLRFKTILVNIEDMKTQVPSDPDDSMILATFLAGQADLLISGDQDLLALRSQYAILTPVKFVQKL